MAPKPASVVALDTSLLTPGLRLAVGVSGGADSVALLRSLHERSRELGLVLHVAHLHHGLRGADADADRDFCSKLAGTLGLPFHHAQVDTAASALPDPGRKSGESIEEAARRLRYHWFRTLMTDTALDAVATAHTLDDQAETVLAKFLRGAWTAGLAGIHPVIHFTEGKILRPMLDVTRADIETYLRDIGQAWREDSSNRSLAFTRNRIRHELLPLLEGWNPRLREHLAHMAELAREEEVWWEGEVARVAPQVLLPGRPVRGGGRAATEGFAVEAARLRELPVALQRRVLRHAAARLGADLDFEGTEALRLLALNGRAGQKSELAGVLGERTHRELHLTPGGRGENQDGSSARSIQIELPGDIAVTEFGIRVQISLSDIAAPDSGTPPRALLRPWKPGDRIRLRHSGGSRKVKEVLERMHVTGSARTNWPVLEVNGRVVWMQGVQLDPEPGIVVSVTPLKS